MRILVTGGSGVLGSQVVARLKAAGHETVVLSRRHRSEAGWVVGDVGTGVGLAAALSDVEVVVHAASAAAEFTRIKKTDIEGTRNLVGAAESSGARHLVYISIVGIDRIDYGYYRAKLAAEKAIEAGDVPWTIVRATQFHELVDRVLRATAKGPLVIVPGAMKVQPVSSSEVATRLVELAVGPPSGRVDDFGGPEVLSTEELGQTWLETRGVRKRIIQVPIPGKAMGGFRAGRHLCPDHRQGVQTWPEWVEQAYAAGRVPTAYGKAPKTG